MQQSMSYLSQEICIIPIFMDIVTKLIRCSQFSSFLPAVEYYYALSYQLLVFSSYQWNTIGSMVNGSALVGNSTSFHSGKAYTY